MPSYDDTFKGRQRYAMPFVLTVDGGEAVPEFSAPVPTSPPWPRDRGDGPRGAFRMGNPMLYSILIYGDESSVAGWTQEEANEVMGRHAQLRRELTSAGQLG